MLLQSDIVAALLNLVSKITEMAFEYGPKLIGAVIVYLIGSMIIGWISKGITAMLKAKNVDTS